MEIQYYKKLKLYTKSNQGEDMENTTQENHTWSSACIGYVWYNCIGASIDRA